VPAAFWRLQGRNPPCKGSSAEEEIPPMYAVKLRVWKGKFHELELSYLHALPAFRVAFQLRGVDTYLIDHFLLGCCRCKHQFFSPWTSLSFVALGQHSVPRRSPERTSAGGNRRTASTASTARRTEEGGRSWWEQYTTGLGVDVSTATQRSRRGGNVFAVAASSAMGCWGIRLVRNGGARQRACVTSSRQQGCCAA